MVIMNTRVFVVQNKYEHKYIWYLIQTFFSLKFS